MPLDLSSRPRLWRLARIGHDRVRQRPVLLYPEGAMFINDSGQAILELCDGARTVEEISRTLGARYQTDVSADVVEYLEGLARRDLVLWQGQKAGGADKADRADEDGKAIRSGGLGAAAMVGTGPGEPPATPAPSPGLGGTRAAGPAMELSSTQSRAPGRTSPTSPEPMPGQGQRLLQQPTTLLAELTYRCPLHCPYCSNPLEMTRAEAELSTDDWKRVFTQARDLGVLQLGLSGGEPLIRKDLEELIAHARDEGLYTTLVTSALGLTRQRAERLKAAGIDHVQISFQDTDAANADRIAGIKLGRQKYEAAALVKALDLAFSVNVVLHRGNLDHLGEIIDMAAELGADRVELANTQYYGWALKNREALMPTREQVERSRPIAAEAIRRYKGQMQIIYVLPDYYEQYPKPCYGGWGSVYILVTPNGRALPCHGATQIPQLEMVHVNQHPLDWIWRQSPIFNAFRGDAWMKEPCRSCPRKAQDFGGCRCQAFALTGDATNTDPVCSLSPRHDLIVQALAETSAPMEYVYREMGAGT